MIPVLGATGGYVWINRIADQRWAAAEVRIRALSTAFPEADSRRETVTDSAKDNQIHLVAAIRLAAPQRNGIDEARRLMAERKGGDAPAVVLDEAQEFLDQLRRGGRRIAANPSDFPPRWHGDWDQTTLVYMMYCGVLRSRQQRERKAPFDAAETLLNSLQLARFWAISGQAYNRTLALECILPSLEELRELISIEPLAPGEFRRLERELEPLDEALHSPLIGLEAALARWAEGLEGIDLKSSGLLDGAAYRWRFLLPGRLMKAEALEFWDGQVRRLLERESKGYAEVLEQRGMTLEEAFESRNPIIRHSHNFIEARGWIELLRMAQLRLLRIAAHYRATGDIPDLQDPFGSVVLHAEKGPRMKFWSLGADGRDDGGDGGREDRWYSAPLPGVASSGPPRDVVIEVPRRH
jgi:hypothetical protein